LNESLYPIVILFYTLMCSQY